MIPPAMAKENAEAKEIPENILENLREVMNVCLSFFTNTTNERLSKRKPVGYCQRRHHAEPQHIDVAPGKGYNHNIVCWCVYF